MDPRKFLSIARKVSGDTRKKYRIAIGAGSWHQRKAGHYASGVIVGEYSDDEKAAFIRNYEARGESVIFTEIEE